MEDCIGEGQRFSAKEGMTCCHGLIRAEVSQPVQSEDVRGAGQLEACEPDAPPDIKVCVACGNGICGPGENPCNCPADCAPADAR